MKSLLFNFFKAFYIALMTLIPFSIIKMPWKVWHDSYKYLATLYDRKNFENKFLNSELKMISWITLFLTCLIFIMYPIGISLITSLFFKGIEWSAILDKMVFLFFVTYFGPLLLTLFKEILSLALLKYFKLESIDENTKGNHNN